MKINMSRLIALLICSLMLLVPLTSCVNTKDDTSNASDNQETSIDETPNPVKDAIDSLYVEELSSEKQLVCVSDGKSYTTAGDSKDNNNILLTDTKYAAQEMSDEGWAAFSYNDTVSIIVNLGESIEGISMFNIDMLYILGDKIYPADTITVSVSDNGTDFTDIGLMTRVTTNSKVLSKIYELNLSGGVKASFVRYTMQNVKTDGYAYIDEIKVYRYATNEETQMIEYKQYYNSKMPDKVTTPVYWDDKETDYTSEKNLISGKIALAFSMRVDLEEQGNSKDDELYKLTDGKKAASTDYNDDAWFRCASQMSYTDARIFIFDLEKTSAISGFKATFLKNTPVSVSLPQCFSIYASENGEVWDAVYRKDGIRLNNTYGTAIVDIKDMFGKSYQARFVAIQFDTTMNNCLDEIEIYGTKSIANAVPVSEKGNAKFFLGEYPKSEDYRNIENMALMYHCYSSKVKDSTPIQGDYNKEHCKKLLGYIDRTGKITDSYFDTFLFLPGGDTISWDKAFMWKVYMDNLFSENYNLDALNEAAIEVGAALGKDDFKAKVLLTIMLPSKNYTSFGDLDGDGKNENLNNLADKQKVIDWLLEQYITRFNAMNYSNLELVGFYWHDEVIRYDDVNLCSAIRYTSDKVHEYGYIFTACPYYLSMGYYDFYPLGVDLVFYQPTYFWKKDKVRLARTASIAASVGMGVELEVENSAITDFEWMERFAYYLQYGIEQGYSKAIHMFYYANPYCSSCDSKTLLGRQLYEMTYQFMKGTLNFTRNEQQYDKELICKQNEVIDDRIPVSGTIDIKLSSSAKYGFVELSKNGKFTYTPFEGFIGEDSFFIEISKSASEKTILEIKITVQT